jgi:NAD-dependent dihydropyrimidine dehydrogenase PreA subunit
MTTKSLTRTGEETTACGGSIATGASCCDGAGEPEGFVRASDINTLAYNAGRCINCGMCSAVCPHGVFAPGGDAARPERRAYVVRPAACMECGACQNNCPTEAIVVDSGVGCAAAMITAALTGNPEPSCGGPEPSCDGAEPSSSCCG